MWPKDYFAGKHYIVTLAVSGEYYVGSHKDVHGAWSPYHFQAKHFTHQEAGDLVSALEKNSVYAVATKD